MRSNYITVGATDPSVKPRADGSIPLFDDIKPNTPPDPEAFSLVPHGSMLVAFALLGVFVIWKGMR